MENSSGRYSSSAAPASSADPGTEPLPPARVPRHPAELFPGFLVRGPARSGHLGHDELSGEQPPEPGGHPQRRLRARDLGQVRQPLRDRRRVVVHHVVDARRAMADRRDRRRGGVGDLDERPDSGPAADHRQLPVVGGGTGIWSFIEITDAAAATIAAVGHGAPGIYNVVDDDPAPVAEWLPYLAQVAGAKPPLRVPAWLGRLLAGEFVVAQMTTSRGSSNQKARKELGWVPRYASWREGFRAWVRG